MIILKRPLHLPSQTQPLSPEQAITELASFLPASQYPSRLNILSDLADGKLICTNFNSYQMQMESTPSRTNPQTSDYDHDYLNKRHLDTFRKLKTQHSHCVMVCSWVLRVSNHGASLITTYKYHDGDGQWSAVQESSEAL